MTVTRGTSNTNQRGSSYSRAVRRAWLLSTYAADVQVIEYQVDGHTNRMAPRNPDDQAGFMAYLEGDGIAYTLLATCRCYRCGCLLVDGTLTVDRIIPGVQGGTYRRNNIRPCCGYHNSETGARLASHPKRRKS